MMERPHSHPGSRLLAIYNTQRSRSVKVSLLRAMTRAVLTSLDVDYELAIHLISAKRMEVMNGHYLNHSGSTDIITFDYNSSATVLRGELFISVPDAARQARQFSTTPMEELARYIIHGLLHLSGYDDKDPRGRQSMKRKEKLLLKRFFQPSKMRGTGTKVN